ncbi:16S rRNA (adenine(1518)-N(6)/adenine(1519)-N(6))-dimethyltransferase RsmA [Methylomarinum sp. Ch1-1]|uniref:Ribosomal RNA small subunit methyltransferase A n=1 Tax=Methylomarinum roseum TaxID=3067653 RepID=A0AAU7NPC3_9GAMM
MTHKARKRFGQNFLQDHNIISNILSYIQLSNEQHWVEIGPGMGALTGPLLQENVKLDVIELDRDLVRYLSDRFGQHQNLTIHSADALNFDFSTLATDEKKLRIIGNLPYNISTPLMFHLLESFDCIEDMHFMLQKEVVDRICAEPGSKRYGRLSIMMQYYCETEFLFEVPPESFSPPPKVMSAIVRLAPHPQAPVEVNDIKQFNELVTQAFSQRRKTIRNSLSKLLSAEQIAAIGIDPSQRAETISLAEFAELSNAVTENKR